MPERKNRLYLSVEEAEAKLVGQRVVMEVKEFDEHHHPLAGDIVYHSRRSSPWKYLQRSLKGLSLEDLRQSGRYFYVFEVEIPEPDSGKALAKFIRLTNQLAREMT